MGDRLTYLFGLYTQHRATHDEVGELMDLLEDPENKASVQGLMDSLITQTQEQKKIAPENSSDILSAIFNSDKTHTSKVRALIPSKAASRFKYAAAIIILFGIGAYLWSGNIKTAAKNSNTVISSNEIQPGKNKAYLILGNGTKIFLDSIPNGTLANEQGAEITKTNDNQIIYKAVGNNSSGPVIYNTMATPRGGEYQLALPDGTKVWLNAASSITYPTDFTGTERNVSITGEVYFQVAKNKSLPFKVKINNETSIEVLGTSFNVNAYNDEPVIAATLLEGSIKVINGKGAEIISPGQQAIIKDQINIRAGADIEKVMAWRRGIFQFRNTSLSTVMRQISRWYDVDIVYRNNPPELQLGGIMSKNLPLSELLKILESTGVGFKLDGRKLEVFKR